MPHALIVDDDPEVVDWLQEVARIEGFTSPAPRACGMPAISWGANGPMCC